MRRQSAGFLTSDRRIALLTAFFLLVAATPLLATTVVPITDRELLQRSDAVVHGIVLSSEVVETAAGEIETVSVVEPIAVVKGGLAGNLTLRQAGGTLPDGRFFKLWGRPEYTPGSEVIVFTIIDAEGNHQTAEMLLGKFEVWRDETGRKFARPDLSIRKAEGVEIAASPLKSGSATEPDSESPARDLSKFIAFLAGAEADSSLTPLPAGELRAVRHNERKSETPQWSNIGGLWRYNNGATSGWQTDGVANGGRGVAESEAALAIWSNDPTSTINLSMGGPNQIHLDAIESPCGWSTPLPPSLGVVGCGGPKGFGSHTHRGESWGTITGGEVWLRRFSSPNQLSSAVIQAVLVHEIGHSIGFGHSDQDASPHDTCRGDENAAIMRSSVGSNSSLGTDDQDGARWLYGDGSKSCGGSSCTAPSITSQPQSTTINAGQVATLSVAAGGTAPVSYQWYRGNSGDTSQPLSGAVNSSINVNPSSTTSYWARASNSCGSANSNTATITVTGAPPPPPPPTLLANFSVSPASGTAGLTNFQFTDASSGTITSRLWNFGDGFTSDQISPSHVYASPGNYTVVLVINGEGGQSSQSKFVSVSPAAPGVNASFSYSPSNPTTDTTVQFVDASTGGVNSWNWSFGDGTGSASKNPAKHFAAPGAYVVSLTVSNGSSSASSSQTVSVAASTPALPGISADFDISTASASVNETITFADRSSGSPTSWTWHFGDGRSSAQRNPTHSYAAPGTYQVTLEARDAASSSSRTKSIVIMAAERFRSLVPVTTQTPGVGSTFWRTELTMFNPGGSAANMTLSFVPGAGGPSVTREFVLSPGGTASYENALPELFGIASGSGALAIEASNPNEKPEVRISSRTFTTSPNGTYGQYVPDVETLPALTFLTGIQSNANFRTNIGLVNKSGTAVNTTLTLVDTDGSVLATKTIPVPGNNFQQIGLVSIFPALSGMQKSGLSMKVQSSVEGAVSCYASTIDNRTQDPIFYPSIPAPGKEVLIPAVARIPGAGGTFWRSDVTILNPTVTGMTLSFKLYVANADNTNAPARTMHLPAGRTVTIEDVITCLGAGNRNGALVISSSGPTVGPVVSSRTYTSRVSDGGTFGQWIDSTETSKSGREAVVTGLRSDSDFRTNLGFVNSGDQPIGVTVRIYNRFGQEIATGFVTVLPRSQTQPSLASLFPHLNIPALGPITMAATTDTAPTLFAYGSVIDNRSGDPIFLRGE